MSADIRENDYVVEEDTETILVEEENTIYELDRACMEKKGQSENNK